jgi:GR25 family glycosyltransferase involved in LPS biosynthesis
MKSYIIAIPNHKESQKAADKCIRSSEEVNNDFKITKFEAITPDRVDDMLKAEDIKWNYPWEGSVTDFASGLTKRAYATKNNDARVACALSHYHLWKSCSSSEESYLILEHDSIFIDRIDYKIIEKSPKLVISINNPRFATRRAVNYINKIKESTPDRQGVVKAPYIDDKSIPQGLPGNSAYIIKPAGAKKMLQLVKEYGLWPNDALMCNQLFFGLGCTQKFYTQVQGIRSTTSL